jgi:hypothetical protein
MRAQTLTIDPKATVTFIESRRLLLPEADLAGPLPGLPMEARFSTEGVFPDSQL